MDSNGLLNYILCIYTKGCGILFCRCFPGQSSLETISEDTTVESESNDGKADFIFFTAVIVNVYGN